MNIGNVTEGKVRLGNVTYHMIEAKINGHIVWSGESYSYEILNASLHYSSGSQITADGENYAYITGDVEVYRGSTYIETLRNVTLTPVKVSGDSNITVSGNSIVGTHRHTTQGPSRSATFRGTYGDAYTSAFTVTQQENQPHQSYVNTFTLSTSYSGKVSYLGDVIPVSFVSRAAVTTTWTSGDTQEGTTTDIISDIYADNGATFDSDTVSGTGTVYLTIPPNASSLERTITMTIKYSDVSHWLLVTQEAKEKPLVEYISWYDTISRVPLLNYYRHRVTLENAYTRALRVSATLTITENATGAVVETYEFSGSISAGGSTYHDFNRYDYEYTVDVVIHSAVI